MPRKDRRTHANIPSPGFLAVNVKRIDGIVETVIARRGEAGECPDCDARSNSVHSSYERQWRWGMTEGPRS